MFSNMLLFVLIWNRTLGSGVWAGWRIVQRCGVVARVFRRLAAVTEKSLRHSWQCAEAWVVWSGVLDLRVLLPAGVPHRHSAELRMQTRHLQHGEAVCTSYMSNSKSVCMCVCSPFWCTAVGQFFSDLDHILPAYSPNGQDGIFAEVSRNASHQSWWLPRSKIVTYLWDVPCVVFYMEWTLQVDQWKSIILVGHVCRKS